VNWLSKQRSTPWLEASSLKMNLKRSAKLEDADYMDAPKGRRHLNQLIRNFAVEYSIAPNFATALLANCVVLVAAQNATLDSALGIMVKGGVRFALRNGLVSSRFTADLDISASRGSNLNQVQQLAGLSVGGFKIESVKRVATASPTGLPQQYAISRFKLRISFMGGEFRSVVLEINQNELGLEDEYQDSVMSAQIAELFALAGLEPPSKVRIFSSEYQFAQKLHALTSPNSDRGHDLFDLCLLITGEHLDTKRTMELVERTFAIRKTHALALPVEQSGKLEASYYSAISDMTAPPPFEESLALLNGFLSRVFTS
jgi:predicted nucleotidyltransferase component of viral defense system